MNAHQQLTLYEAARFALAEARRVDKVKDIRDKAVAAQEYSRQAKDTELLQHATEIRLRAEQRAGELLAAIPDSRGRRANEIPSGQTGISRAPTNRQLGISDTQSSKWQKLAGLPEDKFEIRVAHAKARVEGATTSAPSYSNAEYTGENEWFTPADTVERAREALGEIDLDPASHAIAQRWIRAKTFFTTADNGLVRPWFGRVWFNPPYCRPLLSPFVDKLIAECASGAVSQAILLTHNYTDTEWFHAAALEARSICFPRGRIRFLAPSGDECSPTKGQAFFYFGADDPLFRRTFADVGLIVRPERRDESSDSEV
jgi:hypothetical protein